jgi:hypothetical protein
VAMEHPHRRTGPGPPIVAGTLGIVAVLLVAFAAWDAGGRGIVRVPLLPQLVVMLTTEQPAVAQLLAGADVTGLAGPASGDAVGGDGSDAPRTTDAAAIPLAPQGWDGSAGPEG